MEQSAVECPVDRLNGREQVRFRNGRNNGAELRDPLG